MAKESSLGNWENAGLYPQNRMEPACEVVEGKIGLLATFGGSNGGRITALNQEMKVDRLLRSMNLSKS